MCYHWDAARLDELEAELADPVADETEDGADPPMDADRSTDEDDVGELPEEYDPLLIPP